jgi:hypothetical protein
MAKTSSQKIEQNRKLFIWEGGYSDNKKGAQSVNSLGPRKGLKLD